MSETALMRETLEQGLSQLWGRPVEIPHLSRTPLDSSSSFRTERLSALLDDGSRLPVFFKDLDPGRQTEKARAVREMDLEPSRRELEMYCTVLVPGRTGTLQLYASCWDAEAHRYWMFLEDGGGGLLRNTRNPEAWAAAARWAARFHLGMLALAPGRVGFLPRRDEEYYRRCEESARGILRLLAGAERDLVARGLEAFPQSAAELLALSPTVIHGQFFGQNVLLRGSGPGRRVAVIDWETAAVGPGVADLASLTSGRWSPAERDAMVEAYRIEYQVQSGTAVEPQAFRRQLRAAALCLSLEWMAWWSRHRRVSRDFMKFLEDLERLLAERDLEAGRMPAWRETA